MLQVGVRAFFGSPAIAIEPLCVGKGDAHCKWLIQPPAVWGDKATLTSQRINRSITALETAGGGRMAEKLLLYDKYVQDKEGFSGKVKLAQLTHIPSVQAAVGPDTPEVIDLH